MMPTSELKESPMEEKPVINRDLILGQCKEICMKGQEFIKEGSFEKGINVIQNSLQIIIDTFGELSIEAAKFYYIIGDQLLFNLENSQEIINDMGGAPAGAP